VALDLAGGPGPIGPARRELPRIPFMRNTNVPLCRALRLSVAYCGSLLTGGGIKLVTSRWQNSAHGSSPQRVRADRIPPSSRS